MSHVLCSLMFTSVIGDDECRTSRSIDVRRLGTGLGSPDGVVGCEAGRKLFERDCSCKYMGVCMHTKKNIQQDCGICNKTQSHGT